MNNSFCILAWKHLAIEPNGQLKPCCIARSHIKKPNGENYNIGRDDLDQIINSDYYIKLRTKMLKGERDPACVRCYIQEEGSGTSNRLLYNNKFKLDSYTTTVDLSDITYLDARFGNLCNLKCRSCNPTDSSQFDKELYEIDPAAHKFNKPLDSDINAWYKTDKFRKNIEILENNINLLYMTGGEPTIVEENYKLMESIIRQGRNKNVSLKFSTNLTNITNRFLNLISQFNSVEILCSIEGIGPVQEYLRYPSNWEQIDKNFKKLLLLNNVNLTVTPVIQNVNLSSIAEVITYVDSINKTKKYKRIKMFPLVLEFPSHLNLRYLPAEYKKSCWQTIEKSLASAEYLDEYFLTKMQQVKFMCEEDVDYSQNLLEFKTYTKIYDNHRNQNLRTVNPMLADILDQLHV